MTTINLFDEDGISILVDQYGDITDIESEAVVRVIGHALYACSLDEARRSIQKRYQLDATAARNAAPNWQPRW